MHRTQQSPEAVYSCPDCVGVLTVERTIGRCSYVCQIGHRFSTQSLMLAKEKELEKALWSAVVLLLHTATVHKQLMTEQPGSQEDRRTVRRRIRQATRQRHTLMRMIELTHGAH